MPDLVCMICKDSGKDFLIEYEDTVDPTAMEEHLKTVHAIEQYPAVTQAKFIQIKFQKLVPEAQMPTYAHSDDAGMDLYSIKDTTIWAYHKAVVSTGIAMAIPPGYFGLIRPRSGLAVKNGLTATSSGVIDSGYRGEIKVLLHNLGHQRYEIAAGDRIAQLLILPVLHAVLEETDELPSSTRGTEGHGSTGK